MSGSTRAQLINPGNMRIFLGVPTTSVSFDAYISQATADAAIDKEAISSPGFHVTR